MKKIFFIIVIVMCCLSAFCQNRTTVKENLPSLKFNVEKSTIDKITINPLQKAIIDEIVSRNEKDGNIYQVSESLPLDLTVFNSGNIDELEKGGNLWRLAIKSEGAKALALRFDWFDLPENAEFYAYCDNSDVVFGPYTHKDNISGEEYLIGIIPSDEVFIEYYNPSIEDENRPAFKISAFDYFFRGTEAFDYLLSSKANSQYGNSGSCNVNVNCPEGDNWQTQKKGVCKIYIGNGMCSGTLINNTSNDGTPYILFADHCGGSSSTSTFNQCQFFFNLESSGCSNSNNTSPKTFTGCTRIARGDEDSGSDFLLVKLTNATSTQIASSNLIYNGWDRGTSASPSGVCIHHPAGDNKKISTYTSSATTSTFTNLSNSAWKVNWVQTQTNWGITEGGSSGSPLFNNNGLVVGTLSGGASGCNVAASNKYDLYGKMNYHWNNSSNGSANSNKLQPWLDPNNTGATTCPVFDPNNVASNANFSANPTTVNVGGTVQFTDASTVNGTLTSRSWSFPGGTPSTSTAQNPTITYNTAGTYNVTLTINTTTGNDTETKTGYITVVGNSTMTSFTYDFEACSNFVVDNFSPCTTYDGDNGATGGFNGISFTNSGYTGSYIAMNPSACTANSVSGNVAHGGNKYGACAFSKSAPNNDWFILPRIYVTPNSEFKFYAKSVASDYPESFKVMISTTTNTAPTSFSLIPSTAGTNTVSSVPSTWTEYSYNMNSYAGQNVYLAIVCTSNDKYIFGIDDIRFIEGQTTQAPVADFTFTPNPATTSQTVQFTNQSTGNITNYSWSFAQGTPSSSTQQNPTATWNTAGTYTVSLTVTGPGGTNTVSKTITISNQSSTMTSFTYDFEACSNFVLDNFSPCTTYDGDGLSTYGSGDFDFTNEKYTGSFIAFNPNAISELNGTTNWNAHGGNKFGACFAADGGQNDDWFILPKIKILNGSNFSFWAKSITGTYGLERFNVWISTATSIVGSNPTNSFTKISQGNYIEVPTTWTKYNYNLSNYAGQEVYLAIRCVSNDAFVFQIDDIEVSATTASEEYLILDNVNIYPNPNNGNFVISAELFSDIVISDVNGKIIKQFTNEEENISVNLNIEAGIYFVTIKNKENIITKKIIVN